MTQRANFQNSYLKRYLLLAAVCLFLAAWFGYDGLIGYPKKMEYAAAYDALRDLDAAERSDRWKQLTAEKNWPAKMPTKTAQEISDDINGQYFWAIVNLLFGLPALFLLLKSRGAWVESTEEGLTTSWGQTVRFADVTRLDKKKWAGKGIAKATYKHNGGSRVFVFDDFKFDRQPIDHMLRQLESHLTADQIVGGPPEADLPPPAADSSAQAESPEPQDGAEAHDHADQDPGPKSDNT